MIAVPQMRAAILSGRPSLLRGLVAYWKLDEAAGTRNDSVGSLHLTDVNTVGSTTGKQGNAAAFVAANSESLSRAADGTALDVTGPFTLAGWVRLTDKAATYSIVSTWAATANRRKYLLRYLTGTDRFDWRVSNNGLDAGATVVLANTFGAPSAGTYYFLAVGFDAGAGTVFISVNGGVRDEGAFTGTPFDLSPGDLFELGIREGASGPLNGEMDEWGLWSRALTAAELAELYNSGAGRTTPF